MDHLPPTSIWALMPERLAALAAQEYAPRRSASVRSAGPTIAKGPQLRSVAVVPLFGILTQHPSYLGDYDLDSFTASFQNAVLNPDVTTILLVIDSPGGSVYGVKEASDLVYAARAVKPVVAIANSLAASAAYWIGCSASEFYCTPSGEVGSIGVWQLHLDISGAMEKAGVKPTLISSGKFKVEGNPYEPLGPEAVEAMQDGSDNVYSMFTGDVARGRGVKVSDVRAGMGQGRILGAKEALRQKMIDGIQTLPQVVQTLTRNPRGPGKTAVLSVERARLGLDPGGANRPKLSQSRRELELLKNG